ncbi:hypothetical protein cypCar_00048128 [Cyprinus carpio]|nr:hypothetical protein cypCar_00048128 [Cyprinus carpio]
MEVFTAAHGDSVVMTPGILKMPSGVQRAAVLMTCSKNIFWLLHLNILCVDAEEMVKEITPGYYDDVITVGLKPDRETGVTLLLYNSI